MPVMHLVLWLWSPLGLPRLHRNTDGSAEAEVRGRILVQLSCIQLHLGSVAPCFSCGVLGVLGVHLVAGAVSLHVEGQLCRACVHLVAGAVSQHVEGQLAARPRRSRWSKFALRRVWTLRS